MTGYKIRLLGVPLVEGPQGIVPIRGSKTRALLFYLAAHPNVAVSRAQVASLLWENDDEFIARNSLNTTLSRLRAMLPVWPLITDRQTLRWNTESGCGVDIHSFDQWMKDTTSRGEERWDAVHERRQRMCTMDLWHGEFLADFHPSGHILFADWMRDQRLVWNGRALRVLTELVRLDEEVGDWAAMERHARLGIRIDSFQESLHQAVMLALFRQGDRTAALAHFESVRRLLAVELGIDPETNTVLLRQAIAQQTVPPARAGARTVVPRLGVYRHPDSRGPADTPPIVGRAREMEALWSALPLENRAGYPMVLVRGENGIGKSRLVQEIQASLRRLEMPEVSLLVEAP